MVEITPLEPADCDAALQLWSAMEGLTLRDADRPEALARYLERNPGLSFVARVQGEMVGVVLCGHDGRRGYLHHLAVAPGYRSRGIGRSLAERCLAALEARGILKCHLFVRVENERARAFWARVGWVERNDIVTMSRNRGRSPHA